MQTNRSQFLLIFTALLMAPQEMLHAAGEARNAAPPKGIDRYALVTRHNIAWNDLTGQMPLGNGEFCFNADATGLQTFGGNSLAHWGWHSFPLPEGWTADRVPPTGTFQQGRNKGPDVFPPHTDAIRAWMFDNPHALNLGRLRLVRANGAEWTSQEITGLSRTLDLWSGTQTSSYQINGEPVHVVTCVHPSLDAVTVQIESPLLARGRIAGGAGLPVSRAGKQGVGRRFHAGLPSHNRAVPCAAKPGWISGAW